MSEGNVQVFNATPYSVTLFVNNYVLGRVPGASGPSYTPPSVVAVRTPGHLGPGPQFGTESTVVVAFEQSAVDFTVTIDPNQVPINADVQLFLAFDNALLVLPNSSVAISGSAGDLEKVQELKQSAS
jgi:hypothetical protein